MKSVYSFFLIMSLTVSACTAELSEPEQQPQSCADGINVSVTAPDFVRDGGNAKSTISTAGIFAWSEGSRIGIWSKRIGSSTQIESQLALTLSSCAGTNAAYSSTTGWALVPDSRFNYFAYYPYSETNSREQVTIDYTGQVQSANNSTAGLGEYDYMYSDMSAAATSSSASFSFHHIGCLVNVNITVPEEYESATFSKMTLYADTDEFTSSATYSVDDMMASGTSALVKQACNRISLSFGDAGITPENSVINAWLMMCPAQWNGKTITVKLWAARKSVPTLVGTFTPDANQTAGTMYSYSVTEAPQRILPNRPANGEQLHILLFGHSFGLDCTEYLPAITKAAGITDVHYGRWYQGNCSLAQHWGYVTAKSRYTYYDSDPATGTWNSAISGKVDDVLYQYPWDIILFQQSIGFSGEGDYSSYQPYLNYLTQYVTDYCETVHGKTPIIGWNMFWGYNVGYRTDYDRGTTGALAMYNAIVTATQDMMDDTEINLIVPSGTALQNARNTSLNDSGSANSPSTTKLLTADGYHASYGIGRYVTACTWFQCLIAPIYGTSIIGNSYRPLTRSATDYRPSIVSFENDLVTDERAAICWKCAIEAVNHPYEVTPIAE